MKVTQKKLKEMLHYNPDTGIFTWLVSPSRNVKAGDVAGDRATGYIRISISGVRYQAHRLAFIYINGSIPARAHIDHINHDKSDNRFKNLRICSVRENSMNRRVNINNRSKVAGVCWNKNVNKWQSAIKIKYSTIYLGVYVNWFDAVCARKSAESIYGFHENHGRQR